MKVKDKQDLLARVSLCLMAAAEHKISVPLSVGNSTGWFLMYSSGREKEWVAMANRIVEFVSAELEKKHPSVPKAAQ